MAAIAAGDISLVLSEVLKAPRNDMAALEEEGFIAQPHTSAGRIPTDKGYRLFVDRLSDIKPLSAAERQTPGYARNRGVAQGRAPWIVFLDADTEPSPDLLDRYFETPPAEDTALLAL